MQTQLRPPPPSRTFSGANRSPQLRKPRAVRPLFVSLSVIILLLVVAAGTYTAMSLKQKSRAHAAAVGTMAVTTYKEDVFRTGQNLNESRLTTSTVNVSQFGKRVSYPVDGFVYAQPLFIPTLNIQGSPHDVVFVVTEHDSVYAFDADQTTPTAPLWHTSFINPAQGITTTSSAGPSPDIACSDLVPEVGITGTPVIDLTSGTLYVVAATKENGQFVQRLHALDISTGLEKPHSPVTITASVPGTGAGSSGGQVAFDPLLQNQRAALLLLQGVVYIAWASHCDIDPYHGWVMAYQASTLAQQAVYNDSPNGIEAGIWLGGGGLSSDNQGNIYFPTGNGTFDLASGGVDAGDSVVKLQANTLALADYFTPFNQACLAARDQDLGSNDALVVPGANQLITSGKEGRLYVLNRQNMGKFTPLPGLVCGSSNESLTNVESISEELPPNIVNGGLFGSLSYWNGPTGQFVYAGGSPDHVKAFRFSNGLLSHTPTSQTPEIMGTVPWGGNPTISSNGKAVGTGVLWVLDSGAVALRAYDATNLAKELYNSKQNAARDALPSYVKFSLPTVANGLVFIGTQSTLEIYGLLH